MDLGLDTTQGFIYEGSGQTGYAVWPTPIVSPAVICGADLPEMLAVDHADYHRTPMVFREDSFDAVSHIRRGRLLKKSEAQPNTWHVYPHPAVIAEQHLADQSGFVQKRLVTFRAFSMSQHLENSPNDQPLVLIGTRRSFTIWVILSVETSGSNDELITLKGRQTFGALPRVNWNIVPDKDASEIQRTIDILIDEVHRAGPESVIDRARDAASAILAAYLEHLGQSARGKDLGKLIRLMSDLQQSEQRRIVVNAAEIVRLLHARAKPSERARRGLRRIYEQDGQLATQCVAVMLCDLGWATWNYRAEAK